MKRIFFLVIMIATLVNSVFAQEQVSDADVIQFFNSIGEQHNSIMETIYENLYNEKDDIVNSYEDLSERSRQIFNRINYYAYNGAINFRDTIAISRFNYLSEDLMDQIQASLNKQALFEQLGVSETLMSLYNQLQTLNSSYSSNSISSDEYKAQLGDLLDNNISSLTSFTEKCAFAIAIKIGISSIDYWTEENAAKWIQLYKDLGFNMDSEEISKLLVPNFTSSDSRALDSLTSFASEPDKNSSTTNSKQYENHSKRISFFYGRKHDILYEDIAMGLAGGVTWGIRTGLMSGGAGALAGFFVGGLLEGVRGSAGGYLLGVSKKLFGW